MRAYARGVSLFTLKSGKGARAYPRDGSVSNTPMAVSNTTMAVSSTTVCVAHPRDGRARGVISAQSQLRRLNKSLLRINR